MSKENLKNAYSDFRNKPLPKGLGQMVDEMQAWVDLLDGDISGMVQQHLSGTDVERSFLDWQKRAEITMNQVEKCKAKLLEFHNHVTHLIDLSVQLKHSISEDKQHPH